MKNRIAIITGASSGIGKAAAIRLAGKGIKLVLNARDHGRLAEIRQTLTDSYGAACCRIVCGDIRDIQVTEDCIAECLDAWQMPPDLFLASAGRGLPGTLTTSDARQWDDLIDTNIKGLMLQLKCISRTMVADREKNPEFVNSPRDIIVIGSSIGKNVSPFNSVYGATKFATHGLTEALRRELAPLGIRVSLVEPGLVATNFQDSAGYNKEWFANYVKEVGPVLTAEDIASVIDFMISLPGNVHLDDISIRPTRQQYP